MILGPSFYAEYITQIFFIFSQAVLTASVDFGGGEVGSGVENEVIPEQFPTCP